MNNNFPWIVRWSSNTIWLLAIMHRHKCRDFKWIVKCPMRWLNRCLLPDIALHRKSYFHYSIKFPKVSRKTINGVCPYPPEAHLHTYISAISFNRLSLLAQYLCFIVSCPKLACASQSCCWLLPLASTHNECECADECNSIKFYGKCLCAKKISTLIIWKSHKEMKRWKKNKFQLHKVCLRMKVTD